MNQCTFLGRLTRDPEIRYAQETQMPIARFSIAVDRRRNAGGEQNTDFFPCVVFDQRAEFAEKYLRSGMRIVISGSMQNNNYVNKSGEKVYGVELLGNLIEFADGKREPGAAVGQNAASGGNSRQQSGGQRSAASNGQTQGAGAAQNGGTASGRAEARPASGGTAPSSTGTSSKAASSRQTAGRAPASRTGTRPPARAGVRSAARASAGSYDDFMNVSEGLEDEGLPFN